MCLQLASKECLLAPFEGVDKKKPFTRPFHKSRLEVSKNFKLILKKNSKTKKKKTISAQRFKHS